MSGLVAPHGGTLVNRIVDKERATQLAQRAAELPTITLSAKQACDLEMIAIGAFSPLNGFVKKRDFESICTRMRLAPPPESGKDGSRLSDGAVWPIPITLAVDDKTEATLVQRGQAALRHADGTLMAIMDTTDIYPHDKKLEIANVFGTEDDGDIVRFNWEIGGWWQHEIVSSTLGA